MKFRAEDVDGYRPFAVALDDTGEGGKYNRKTLEEEMKILEEEFEKVEEALGKKTICGVSHRLLKLPQ